ncbi:MAG: response regulator transcription factor [Saprospiraceae bacterium]|nr:response regulator transcription factor [Saprospiraceae bacterium]
MRILLIEDDPTLSQNIKADLSAQGFTVDVAFDGQVAEKMLRQFEYDCIVLDINLPHKNGYQLTREFRSHDVHTPILMLTAFSELQDKLDGFEAGADDYLGKPFYHKELVARIKALLKRKSRPGKGNQQHRRYRVRNLELIEEAKQVLLDGAPLDLTPREYQILLLLLKGRGNVVSKQEFIREIWGRHFEANTNTIEVYINLLRNKIDKTRTDRLIKTRVGFGYYIDEDIHET